MKAIGICGTGGLDVLVSTNVPIPRPAPTDLLIRVQAISVNPVEAKIRAGKWAGGTLPSGSILGFDAAGIVDSIGSEVPPGLFQVGDGVWLLGSTLPSHSNAEYMVSDYRVVSRKPKSLTFEDAAAFPLVGLTAWELLVDQMKVGEVPGAVLIINGAGGVGSVATQIARHVLGVSTVIATASRTASINHTKKLGATHIISHREPLKPQIDALSLGIPIQYIVILTTTTKTVLDEAIDIVAPWGKIGLAVQGPPGCYEGLGAGQKKGISIHWGFVFTKMILQWKVETQGQILSKLADLVDKGAVQSITTQKLDLTLDGLRQAHALMESGQTIGKVVLRVPEQDAFQ
ncbi:hypothetical protein JAAARDRAFT_199532 [Jaapia argillacea MUCL 33604]|uniref:Enoyl reductase (ER) domain-containing protein n=1 Tax=Jaapia argillacea MUCL 33604 TaxID=933084 RepID=A0A067PB02_9AGAM|nr:hypothetical protein JAAARDRAFT_199532 [Jaapia argillacea MUCL 33604]